MFYYIVIHYVFLHFDRYINKHFRLSAYHNIIAYYKHLLNVYVLLMIVK